MKTRSEWSSRLSPLGTRSYGGGMGLSTSPDTTRFGPSSPRCSQTLDEPGPPLKANVTGRVLGSAPFTAYEVMKTLAFGLKPDALPSSKTSSRRTIRPVDVA
jgi:hypothetical protein